MNLASSSLLRRLPVAAGAVLVAVLAASPAQAASDRLERARTDRPGAERALRAAETLAQGRGDGRELTPALASLSGRTAALSPDDRKAAAGLLARPTNNTPGQPGGPYTVASVSAYTAHFCIHWVTTTNDAPPMTNADGDAFPDYVETVAEVFETVFARQHAGETEGGLWWNWPISDGETGGCSNGGPGLTDVYLKDLGELGLYGYAAPDPGQDTQRPYAFLVMDDDYLEYGYDDWREPLKVTAAHEYNHVVQFAYDVLQDKWMFESTATWMEEKVYPEIDDYHQYVGPWAQLTGMPITRFDRENGDKVYGSAVFNHWLDEVYGEDVVRRAWELSIQQGSFAPGAYDKAIRLGHGPGFSYELDDFAASTAEWRVAASRVRDGAAFPDVKRTGLTLPTDGSEITGKLDHTAYALFDVARTNAPRLELTGGLPEGKAGGIALVGRVGDKVWKTIGALPQGGKTTVKLDDPGQYERITAVVVNSDYGHAGWNGQAGDWKWTGDQQPVSLAARAVTPGGGGGEEPGGEQPGGGDGGRPDGGGGGTPGGGGGVPGGGVTPSTTLLRIVPGALPRLAKASSLPLKAQAGEAGAFSARATVDARTAKRLGLGRRAAAIGTGKATLAAAGTAKLAVKLTARARARLKRARSAVKVAVRITFTPAAGAPTTRTLTLTLKR